LQDLKIKKIKVIKSARYCSIFIESYLCLFLAGLYDAFGAVDIRTFTIPLGSIHALVYLRDKCHKRSNTQHPEHDDEKIYVKYLNGRTNLMRA
jgi:hypothetical protein